MKLKKKSRDSGKIKKIYYPAQTPFQRLKHSEIAKNKTATSILLNLQKKYPGEYTDGQCRTLQRRVKAWRKKAIITYDDAVLKEDSIIENSSALDLKAVTIGTSKEKQEECFTI